MLFFEVINGSESGDVEDLGKIQYESHQTISNYSIYSKYFCEPYFDENINYLEVFI